MRSVLCVSAAHMHIDIICVAELINANINSVAYKLSIDHILYRLRNDIYYWVDMQINEFSATVINFLP